MNDSAVETTRGAKVRTSLPLASIALAFVLSRVFIAFFVYLGHASHPFQEKIEGSFAGVSNWFLNPWTVFDSQHFMTIARSGYSPETAPFFPLYPLSLRLFGSGENAMALTGVAVSNTAFLGALVLFFMVTRETYGAEVGHRAVWMLAFFPAAAYGMAVYTESLFMLLALGTFWFARQSRWMVAVPLGFLAALTRNSGPILALALFFEWRRQVKAGTRTSPLVFAAMLAPLAAFLGVQLYIQSVLGGGASSISSQAAYGRALTWPWMPLWRDAVEIVSGRHLELVTILNLGSTVLALVLLWRHRRTMPASDGVFLGAVMLIQLSLARIWPPFTIASLRYLFSTWPFTQLLALESEKLFSNRFRLVAASTLYLLLCAVHSYLFGLKSFLG